MVDEHRAWILERYGEKGARFLRAVTERVADFLVDLAGADPDDLYE